MRQNLLITVTAALAIAFVGAPPASAVEPTVVATVSVGSSPSAVAVAPNGTYAYVSNTASNTVSVIDLTTQTVTATITGVAAPLGLAFTPDGSEAYVTVTNGFARIDTATHSVVQTISGGLCTRPLQIVANPAGGAMYAACGSSNRGASINTADQSVNAGLVIVTEAINDVAIFPDGGSLVWARDTQVYFQGTGARTTTTSAPTALATVQGVNRVFTANSGSGTLNILDSTTQAISATITVGGAPQDIALSSDAGLAYVPDSTGNQLLVVDTDAQEVLYRVSVGNTPQAAALTPNGRYVVIANNASNSVSIVDLGVNSVASIGSAEQFFEIQLSYGDQLTCSPSAVSGVARTWIVLPAEARCPGAMIDGQRILLGWATSAQFPVQIAQRQYINDWGPYESFDEDGRLNGVFIPAGKAAHLTGDTTLYAIWGPVSPA